jgi:peptide/nickel transport system substrate-binding protein
MERFDGYFGKGHPLLDRVIIKEYKDPASLLLALERGEIDIHTGIVDPLQIERAKKAPNVFVQAHSGPAIGPIIWLAFNTKHPQLSDKRVRQAINYAIDKDFILKTLLGNVHKRAVGPIVSASPFHNPNVEHYKQDLAKAAALLDAAGLKVKADGTRFGLSVDAIPGVADMKVTQEYLKPALAKIGIDVTLRASPDFPTWARRVSTFEFDMTLDSVWNWGDPVIGVHRTWLSSNIRKGVIWSNTQSYSNPRVDELLAQAGKEMDVAKRKALYQEFQKIVVDDCPVAFIQEVNFNVGYRTRVQNRPTSVWGLISPFDDMGVSKA